MKKYMPLIILGGIAAIAYFFLRGQNGSAAGGGGYGGGSETPPISSYKGAVQGQVWSASTDRYITPRTPFISYAPQQPVAGSKFVARTTFPKLSPQIIVTGSGWGYLKPIIGPTRFTPVKSGYGYIKGLIR